MRKLAINLMFLMAMTSQLYAQGYQPPNGIVPDKETAVKIAVVVLEKIYGHQVITLEMPFTATLRGELWFVTGHLDPNDQGGVAELCISKKDGRITRIRHEK